jgi:uncharacterized protein with HEPN domain
MSERDPNLLLTDMLDAVNTIFEFTESMSFEEFVNDRKTRDASLRNLQILGEAANRVPSNVRDNYPEIEWTKIIRSRHIIVHDYAGVDYEIVWRIIEVYLQPLKIELIKILNR